MSLIPFHNIVITWDPHSMLSATLAIENWLGTSKLTIDKF